MSIQLPLFNDETLSGNNRPLPELLATKHSFALAYHDTPDGRLYSVQDWLVGVAQTDNPRRYWSGMQSRFEKDGIRLYAPCVQLPYKSSNGRTYQLDHATDMVLYQITQRMDTNTGIRNEVLDYLAKAGVKLDEFRRNPALMLKTAERHYLNEQMKRHNLTEGQALEALDLRRESKDAFELLTDALKRVCIRPNYGAIIDTEYFKLLGYTAGQLRGMLDTKDVRDALPTLALSYVKTAELSIRHVLDHRQSMTNEQIIETVISVCEPLGRMLQNVSKQSGVNPVTGKPLLGTGTQD